MSDQQQFRTRTGQTGLDAYTFEAAQLRNLQRELDERAARLVRAIVDELPADASCEVSIASDRYPDATMTCDREGLARILPMFARASEAELILDYTRGVYRPGHVVERNQLKLGS